MHYATIFLNPGVTMKIAYDTELKRPGCVLIQAAMGGDPKVAHEFPTSSWLTAPTKDMKVYPVNEKQLAYLVQLAKEQGHES